MDFLTEAFVGGARAGEGVIIEDGSGRDFTDTGITVTDFNDDEVAELQNAHVVTFHAGPAAKVQITPTPVGRSEEVYDLVLRRAAEKFAGERAFPVELYGAIDVTAEEAYAFCAAKEDSTRFSIPEASVRWLLYMTNALGPEDFKQFNVVTEPLDTDELYEGIKDTKPGNEMQYIATVAVSHLAMAVTKPFVQQVTRAVNDMATKLRDQLRLADSDCTAESHRDMYLTYFSKVDMRALARTFVGRSFEGAAWLSTYALRFSSGTTHLSLISSLIKEFPDCPLWGFIPAGEVTNFERAVAALEADPFLLFPTADNVNKVEENFRVAGMRHIVFMAYIVFRMVPNSNWGRYQNLPVANEFVNITTSNFMGLTASWMQYKGRAVDALPALKAGIIAEVAIPGLEGMGIERHLQVGGKKIPALRGQIRRS